MWSIVILIALIVIFNFLRIKFDTIVQDNKKYLIMWFTWRGYRNYIILTKL